MDCTLESHKAKYPCNLFFIPTCITYSNPFIGAGIGLQGNPGRGINAGLQKRALQGTSLVVWKTLRSQARSGFMGSILPVGCEALGRPIICTGNPIKGEGKSEGEGGFADPSLPFRVG